MREPRDPLLKVVFQIILQTKYIQSVVCVCKRENVGRFLEPTKGAHGVK
jgi:hypothetical protein